VKKKLLLGAMVAVVFGLYRAAYAQADSPKLEVGTQYSMMNLEGVPSQNTSSGFFSFGSAGWQHGFGGRIIFSPASALGLEAELNLFPNGEYIRPLREGHSIQALFGVKAGKRSDRVGVFGKLRPGFMRFSKASDCPGENFMSCTIKEKTELVVDIGGVFEFYPSRRCSLRVDIGDTMIRYGNFKVVNIGDDRGFPTVPFEGGTAHNLQVSFGVSYRF